MSEFKNENVNVKIENSPGCQVKLAISVTPQATESARAKAIKNINKEIVIPGFRKGKAPADLVLQKFASHIDDEWRTVLVNTAFNEALDLTKVYPLSQNQVKPKINSLSLENGSEIEISYETRPNIPSIDPKKITLTNVPVQAVTEKDIEDRTRELQLHQATWENITDRGIQDGDFAHLDIESVDNPSVVICKDQPFSVEKGKIGTWLYKALLNKNLNEVFECMSEKDDCGHEHECNDPTHDHNHTKEFKPSNLKITIHTIKKPTFPEVNTEFASKLGVDSVEKLRERVITSLENNYKEYAQDELREQVKDSILKDYPFDIPASILKSHGKSLEGDQLNKLTESYRLYFITEKLAHDLQLDVTQDEIMQEFMVQAYMTRPEDSYIDPQSDPKEINHHIRSRLLEKKVNDYLIEHANKA